ncbi:hypothetical protein [Mesorhizobium caraganae]
MLHLVPDDCIEDQLQAAIVVLSETHANLDLFRAIPAQNYV